jgi:hypothetical protein
LQCWFRYGKMKARKSFHLREMCRWWRTVLAVKSSWDRSSRVTWRRDPSTVHRSICWSMNFVTGNGLSVVIH